MIDFDVVLQKVGTIGTYQIGLFAILCYSGVPSGLNAIAPVFLSYTPDYRCDMGPLDNETIYPNLTEQAILNVTTPLDEKGEPVDECVRYGYDLDECNGTDLSCVNRSEPTIACDRGFHYDDSIFEETVVTEFNLVCDRRVLNSVATSSYMAGMLVGSLICGILADKFGRKWTIVVSGYGVLLTMLGMSFVRSVELYSACRFFIAAFMMGCRVVVFVHVLEIVGTRWRTPFGIAFQITYVFGYLLWSGIGYLWPNWHAMELAAFVVSSPFFILSLIAPESPRWLFTKGRDKEGKKVTATMAKINKVKLDETVWTEAETAIEDKEAEDKVVYSTIDLFRYPRLRICTLKVAFNWAVNSMVYYGVSLNAGALAGDIFVNNALAGVLEIASYTFCALTMDYIGRRLLLTITLTGAGVALLTSTICNEYAFGSDVLGTMVVVFAFAGKALVSGSFAIIYNFTGELYPTVVRSNAVGFGSTSARIGSILSPFIIGIQDYVTWVPNAIFGSFAVVGGLMSLTFRDTTGFPMMETLEEAEAFHAGKSFDKDDKEKYAYGNGAAEMDGVKVQTKF